MTRNPAEVKEILRKEVNFGCPIDGCGIPYLKYHHFDPEWKIENHNRPEGIIALCALHSDHADGNNFTKDQLREFKKNPFLKSNDKVKEKNIFRGMFQKVVDTFYCSTPIRIRVNLRIEHFEVLFQRTLVVVILPIALQWATVNCHSVASLP